MIPNIFSCNFVLGRKERCGIFFEATPSQGRYHVAARRWGNSKTVWSSQCTGSQRIFDWAFFGQAILVRFPFQHVARKEREKEKGRKRERAMVRWFSASAFSADQPRSFDRSSLLRSQKKEKEKGRKGEKGKKKEK